METYEPQTLETSEEQLLFSVSESRASRLPLPESDEARLITAGSGRQCSMLLDTSTPLGQFSKILMESLAFGICKSHLHVWQRMDTQHDVSAFQLVPLEHHISETGFSLLPTLISSSWRSGKVSQATMDKNARPLQEVLGQSLTPAFCERYMGFEIGATELKHSATASVHSKRTRSSRRSPKS